MTELKAELARLTAWIKANTDKVGSKEYRRALRAHRLLTDHVERSQGTAAEIAAALKDIEEGKHDPA